MDGTDTPRGATDLDRLLYFIAAVVAVLLVVPPAFGLAGFDVRDGTLIGGEEPPPAEINAGHGSFAVSGDTVLEDSTDRAVLRFDLGTSDLSGVDPFGDSLEPGDTVTVSVTTAAGAGTSRVLTVPDPLPSGAGVPL